MSSSPHRRPLGDKSSAKRTTCIASWVRAFLSELIVFRTRFSGTSWFEYWNLSFVDTSQPSPHPGIDKLKVRVCELGEFRRMISSSARNNGQCPLVVYRSGVVENRVSYGVGGGAENWRDPVAFLKKPSVNGISGSLDFQMIYLIYRFKLRQIASISFSSLFT
jgi:hypothetical protein